MVEHFNYYLSAFGCLFEWDGEYLIDWRGEPLEDIDEDIEYLDESPSSDPAESKGNETIWEEMINKHIKPMYGSLEAASIKYFIEKGTVNGSFRLRLIAMMKFYELRVCKADPAEVLELRQWKKEATALLDPILEYGLKHPDIKLGQSATSFVLNRAKAAEVLVKALTMIRDESGTYRNYQAGSIAAYALAEYEQLKQQT